MKYLQVCEWEKGEGCWKYSGLHQVKEHEKPKPGSWAALDEPVMVSTKWARKGLSHFYNRDSQIPGIVESIWPSTQLPGGGHIWWVTATPPQKRGPRPAARLHCVLCNTAKLSPAFCGTAAAPQSCTDGEKVSCNGLGFLSPSVRPAHVLSPCTHALSQITVWVKKSSSKLCSMKTGWSLSIFSPGFWAFEVCSGYAETLPCTNFPAIEAAIRRSSLDFWSKGFKASSDVASCSKNLQW